MNGLRTSIAHFLLAERSAGLTSNRCTNPQDVCNRGICNGSTGNNAALACGAVSQFCCVLGRFLLNSAPLKRSCVGFSPIARPPSIGFDQTCGISTHQ